MFEEGKEYWFEYESGNGKIFKLKGKIIEQNQFMIKIRTDRGKEEIIPLRIILHVNENINRNID